MKILNIQAIPTVKTNMQIKYTPILLVVLFLSISSFAQTESVKLSSKDDIKNEVALAPCKNDERLETAKKLFQQMGAADSDITVEKFKDIQNLIVTKKGKTDETVIVGAHYDKVKDGCGAIDNWTGIVIIANLYRSLKDFPTNKTYLFVAFDKEEAGLLGSNAMAKTIPKEKRVNYCSMVNLDSFGFNYPQVLDNTSNSKMTEMAKSLAKEVDMPFSHASLAGSADADSSSFISKDIPAVTFHGLSGRWQEYLHSNNDKVENINTDSVFVGYRFILQYLAKIDIGSCNIFRK